MQTNSTRLLAAAIIVMLASSVASAAGTEQPAAPAPFGAIDPNTFILGHPASPRWKIVHAGGEHPAVIVASRAEHTAAIDPNLFVVQPPASVRWLAASELPLPAVAIVAR